MRTLLDHTLAFSVLMTDAANGAPMPDAPPSGIVGSDPVGAVAETVLDSLAAWRRPGALEAVVATPLGPLPGAHAVSFVVMEVAVHGTDLARATGQDDGIDPELAATVLAVLQGMPLDDIRATGRFGPEVPVPAGADAADRVLGLTGRRP